MLAIKLNISQDWKGKKVVIFAVPGAFTVSLSPRSHVHDDNQCFPQPTCHVNHLPPYIEKYDEFKAKGVDVIAVVAANDAFVMSGWGRFEGLKDKVSFGLCRCIVLPYYMLLEANI